VQADIARAETINSSRFPMDKSKNPGLKSR